MTEYPFHIRLANKKIVEIAMDCVCLEQVVCLTIRGRENLYFEIFGWSREFHPLFLKWARVSDPSASYSQRIASITPEQVIAYFEASPDLWSMADDVRQALQPAGQGGGHGLAGDIQKCRHLAQPSLADISEIIYGQRYYSGKQHGRLKQIQLVLANANQAGLVSSSSAIDGADLPAEEAA